MLSSPKGKSFLNVYTISSTICLDMRPCVLAGGGALIAASLIACLVRTVPGTETVRKTPAGRVWLTKCCRRRYNSPPANARVDGKVCHSMFVLVFPLSNSLLEWITHVCNV